MAIFQYVGIDKHGKQVKGLKEADSIKALRASLRASGIFVTKASESAAGSYSAGKAGLKKEVNIRQLFERVNVETLALAT